MKAAVQAQRKMAADAEAVVFEDLKAKGMQYEPLSPATAAELRKATAGIVDDVKKRAGADLVNQVIAEARQP